MKTISIYLQNRKPEFSKGKQRRKSTSIEWFLKAYQINIIKALRLNEIDFEPDDYKTDKKRTQSEEYYRQIIDNCKENFDCKKLKPGQMAIITFEWQLDCYDIKSNLVTDIISDWKNVEMRIAEGRRIKS